MCSAPVCEGEAYFGVIVGLDPVRYDRPAIAHILGTLRVYMCMYVYIYVYINTYKYLCSVPGHMQKHTFMYMYTYTRIKVGGQSHISSDMYACVHTCYVHVYLPQHHKSIGRARYGVIVEKTIHTYTHIHV